MCRPLASQFLPDGRRRGTSAWWHSSGRESRQSRHRPAGKSPERRPGIRRTRSSPGQPAILSPPISPGRCGCGCATIWAAVPLARPMGDEGAQRVCGVQRRGVRDPDGSGVRDVAPDASWTPVKYWPAGCAHPGRPVPGWRPPPAGSDDVRRARHPARSPQPHLSAAIGWDAVGDGNAADPGSTQPGQHAGQEHPRRLRVHAGHAPESAAGRAGRRPAAPAPCAVRPAGPQRRPRPGRRSGWSPAR